MKRKIIYGLLAVCFSDNFYGQQILETREGDPLFNPMITNGKEVKEAYLIKTNIAEQSLGAELYHILPKIDTSADRDQKYWFFSVGIKAKATEGVASVIKNKQFSPGINGNLSLNKFKIFDKNDPEPNERFADWGGFYLNVGVSKFQFYRGDTLFKDQLYTKNFTNVDLGFNYNMLYNSRMMITFKAGYSRKSNFSELDEIEVADIKTSYDSVSATFRETSTSKAARQGKNYKEFDMYNIKLAITRLTNDGKEEKTFGLGTSVYCDISCGPAMLPSTNAGVIVFLSQTNKAKISSPVLGFNFQFYDIADNKRTNNGLVNRLSVGLTSVISLR